jgi:hypothetical protein
VHWPGSVLLEAQLILTITSLGLGCFLMLRQKRN